MAGGNQKRWFDERLYGEYHQSLEMAEVLFEETTEHQDMVIFESPLFGRVLALDGIVQTTEKDEFIYHEMLAHVPILAHGAVKSVLIIGGGDGGALREVLRHPGVQATMVEIDPTVVDLSKQYLPTLSDGAFDNPRGELVIADGLEYVKQTDKRFDVIIVDSTDPVGPGAVLFTKEFYADCKSCMTDGGILITQNGVPFFQGHEVTDSKKRLSSLFSDVAFFMACVPTYAGGFMTLGWATDNPAHRQTSEAAIAERFARSGIKTRYYNPALHKGSFGLPQYVVDLTK